MKKKVDDSAEDCIEEYNRLAMTQLTSEKHTHAMAYLNQALFKVRLMPESSKKNSLTALTYNNLGCFYKRVGQVDQALDYFLKSVDLETNGAHNNEVIANTNLNISFLLSLKNEHEKSLRYSIKALMILKKSYKDNPGLIVSIINCYSRIGIEYKLLNQFPSALQCFKKGYEICSKLKNSGLQKNFKKLYIECLRDMGSDKKIDKNLMNSYSKTKIRRTSMSPKSTFESHTTV